MKIVSLQHQIQCPRREPAHHGAIQDADGDLEGTVPRVEVRGRVMVVVHRDHDAQEPRDLRHASYHPAPCRPNDQFCGPADLRAAVSLVAATPPLTPRHALRRRDSMVHHRLGWDQSGQVRGRIGRVCMTRHCSAPPGIGQRVPFSCRFRRSKSAIECGLQRGRGDLAGIGAAWRRCRASPAGGYPINRQFDDRILRAPGAPKHRCRTPAATPRRTRARRLSAPVQTQPPPRLEQARDGGAGWVSSRSTTCASSSAISGPAAV